MKKFGEFYGEVAINEISDRSNVNISWSDETHASFNAGGERFSVEIDESNNYGEFTITFQNSGGYGQTGKQGHGAAAVFSGVLTTLREFTEAYDAEKDMNPFSFDFSAAYELASNHPMRNELRLMNRSDIEKMPPEADDQIRGVLKDLISRPMLYYAMSLTFGKSHGYSTEVSDKFLLKMANGANDFRSVRKNVTRSIQSMDKSELIRALDHCKSGSVSFMLTNDNQSSADYDSAYGEVSLEDTIDDADQEQIERWINDDREDDIIEHADWQTLVRIAEWGLMHNELIRHEDEDVRGAVVSNNTEMADELVTSSEWEHRKQAAEMGFGIHELVFDADDDVRTAAWDYATEELDDEDRIELVRVMQRNLPEDGLSDALDWMIDFGEDTEKVYVAQSGYRLNDLMSEVDEDVREAAMASTFDNYDENSAVDFILQWSDSYAQENFEWIMNQNYGPSTEEHAVEVARDNGLDVSEWEDEDEIDDPEITDVTTHEREGNTKKIDVTITDSDGDDEEITIERDYEPAEYRVLLPDGGVETFKYAWQVGSFVEDKYEVQLASNSDVWDAMKY